MLARLGTIAYSFGAVFWLVTDASILGGPWLVSLGRDFVVLCCVAALVWGLMVGVGLLMGRSSTGSSHSPLLAANDRPAVRLQHIGVRFMISGSQTGGSFSVVDHPIDPASLAAPYHTHTREDEYSLVLEGDVGFALDDQVIVGHPGDTIFKPRNIRHAFWNASNAPARTPEIIAPSGFEHCFVEIGEVFAKPGPPDAAALASIANRYGLTMERSTAPELIAKHRLQP